MKLFIWILLIYFISLAQSHSHKPSPLTRLSNPEDVSIDVLPRDPHTWPRLATRDVDTSPTLKFNDKLRISFSLDGQQFNLHLHPNEDLFHPDARVNFFANGAISHSELLQKENYRVYHGYTVASEHSDRRVAEDAARIIRDEEFGDIFNDDHVIRGRASIMIHDDGVEGHNSPQFEGSFTFDDELYHVKTPSSYLATMGDDDPSPSYHPSRLIIFKESDTVERANTTLASSCATDNRHYPSLTLDTPVPPFTFLEKQPAWTSPIMKWLDVLFGAKSSPKKPFVRFAPLDDHTLDRAVSLAKDRHRMRIKRQGTGDISGGNDKAASTYVDSIGSTEGCPTEQRLVYMGFAADCTFVQNYDSQENARTQILQDVNQISGLYKDTFRISLGVIELNVQEPTCPTSPNETVPWNQACDDSVELNDRLSLFSSWRGQKGDDGAGLWHLMTKCNTGSEVGVAWISTLCQQESNSQGSQSVSGTAVTAIARNQWAVAAHEIGHNFGAVHDCEEGCNLQQPCCPLNRDTCNADNKYIMSATSSDSATKFSDCTVGNICSAMGSGSTSTSCLADPSNSNRNIISLQQCGNGVVEDDEECDGSGETNCCTADCKFKSGAVCDSGTESCCNDDCQFAPSTKVCRPSIDDSCDYEERCTGDSGACPADNFRDNGDDCGGGRHCATGLCTSEDDQCRSAGASMGLTSACDRGGDDTCLVTCNSPQGNGCVRLQTPLRDGSQCGYGGTCQKGDCQKGSWQDTFRNWYRQNLQIAIPVTIIIAIVVILVLYGLFRCIFGGCCRRRRPGYMAAAPLPPKSKRNRLFARGSPNMPGGYAPPSHPPPAAYGGAPYYPPPPNPPRMREDVPSHWVDPAVYNGRDYGR